jgi:hypothetical protein
MLKELVLKSQIISRTLQILKSFRLILKEKVQIVRFKTKGDFDVVIVRCPDKHVDKVIDLIVNEIKE